MTSTTTSPQVSGGRPASARVDTLVVGGGPAGLATAIGLARTGQTIAVLERTCYDTSRVGEVLPPAIRLLLGELGVWEQFLADKHLPSPGIVSVWGSSEIYENDFIFDPHGHGWHIDRRRFDEMLALAAEQLGISVYRSAQITDCIQLPAGDWQIKVKCGEQTRCFQTSFLVDAGGRNSSTASCGGPERISYDRLVGVMKVLSVDSPEAQRDHRTLIEASENGWWYSAYLPDARLVVAYMTDADQIPRDRASLAQDWSNRLRQVPHTRQRVDAGARISDLRIVAANSYQRVGLKGRNYLIAGDAAAAVDPLSSQGIFRALESGLAAAAAIDRHCHGDLSALDDYEDAVVKKFADYLTQRSDYYSRETRWPGSSFWRRRHAANSLEVPASSGDIAATTFHEADSRSSEVQRL